MTPRRTPMTAEEYRRHNAAVERRIADHFAAQFDYLFEKRIPCPACGGAGVVVTGNPNPYLPITHPGQPTKSCPLCNGMKMIPDPAAGAEPPS